MGLAMTPLLRSFLIDTAALLLLIVIWICFNADFWADKITMQTRGWFLHDHSIAYPYAGSGTFPTFPYLIGYGFVIPILLIIVLWFILDWPLSNEYNPDIEATNQDEIIYGVPLHEQINIVEASKRYQQDLTGLAAAEANLNVAKQPQHYHWAHYNNGHSPRNRKIRYLLYVLYVFIIVSIICIILTTSLKLMVRSFRPDFLDRCQPDYTKAESIDVNTGWVTGKIWDICTTNHDVSLLYNSLLSFPSGHSSTSLTGGTFMAILLYKRLWNRSQRSVGFVVIPFAMLVSIGFGLVISASRHWDNRHRFADISIGCLIGIVCALSTFLFPYVYTPSWERDGSAIISKYHLTNETSSGYVLPLITSQQPQQPQQQNLGQRQHTSSSSSEVEMEQANDNNNQQQQQQQSII